MGNHGAIIFYYIIIRLILNIFFKTLYIWQKNTKIGSKNFGYQIWFCTRLLSDDIWHHGSYSTLVQVMACCLTAPSHCLNQCWLVICIVLYNSPTFENYTFKIKTTSRRGQWVNFLQNTNRNHMICLWGWGMISSKNLMASKILYDLIWDSVSKIRKIFTGLMYKLFLYDNFRCLQVLYHVFIPNKITNTKYCLTQWISNLLGSIEIHIVSQYLVNFMGLQGLTYPTARRPGASKTGCRASKFGQIFLLNHIYNLVLKKSKFGKSGKWIFWETASPVLMGIINTTVYKTKAIFTGLEHSKLS